MNREDLLQPTIAAQGRATAIYSAQATFFTAFFGGPVAAIIMGVLNSRRVGQLKRDALVYASGLLFFAGLTYIYFAAPAFIQDMGIPESGDGNVRTYRYISRALALLIWIAHYFLLRSQYKTMKLLETDPPSPWIAALSAIGLSLVATTALVVTFQ